MKRIVLVAGLVVQVLYMLPAAAQKNSAHITVQIKNLTPADTLCLLVWRQFLSDRTLQQMTPQRYVAVNNKGSYYFSIDSLKGAAWFSLAKDRFMRDTNHYAQFTPYFLLEPGDKVKLNADSLISFYNEYYGGQKEIGGYYKSNLQFAGRGAGKYRIIAQWEKQEQEAAAISRQAATAAVVATGADFYAQLPAKLEKEYRKALEKVDGQLRVLHTLKDSLSPLAYQVLKAQLVAGMESARLMTLLTHRSPVRREPLLSETARRQLLDSLLLGYQRRPRVDMNDVHAEALTCAMDYIGYLADEAYYADTSQYYALEKMSPGLLRDKVIAQFVIKWKAHMKNSAAVLQDAEAAVKDTYWNAVVKSIGSTMSAGSSAYNFNLPEARGKKVQLSDLKGKVVFIDLWYTGCGACAGFYKYQLSRVEEHFKDNKDVVFVTISIDTERTKWLESLSSGTYSNPDAANVLNLFTEGKGVEHPLIKAYRVIGYPYPFLVDKNGKIFQTNNLQTKAEDIITAIEKALKL